MTPRKLHCPDCGTFISRDLWPVEPVRVIRHDCDAAPSSVVRVCKHCGPVECHVAPRLLRWLRVVLHRPAA